MNYSYQNLETLVEVHKYFAIVFSILEVLYNVVVLCGKEVLRIGFNMDMMANEEVNKDKGWMKS